MKSNSYGLFGRNTRNIVGVSYGGAYRSGWSLEQHPGPTVLSYCLRGKEGVSPIRYLYPQHLELLYGRFCQANPAGVELANEDELYARYARELGRETVDRMMEERSILGRIDLDEGDLGYPHLRPYLPEIFEPGMALRMEADAWLDNGLLQDAIKAREVPDRRDYHPRWSPEWRAYCDRLPAQQG